MGRIRRAEAMREPSALRNYACDELGPALKLTRNCELRGVVTGSCGSGARRIQAFLSRYYFFQHTNFRKSPHRRCVPAEKSYLQPQIGTLESTIFCDLLTKL
jgi:hypothetical protein